MENVRNRLKIKFVKKDDYREIMKQQYLNCLSMEFMNHMRIVIVIPLNKMKCSWISRYI